jgi:hypothetical protein
VRILGIGVTGPTADRGFDRFGWSHNISYVVGDGEESDKGIFTASEDNLIENEDGADLFDVYFDDIGIPSVDLQEGDKIHMI